jgi:purine nucleosidase
MAPTVVIDCDPGQDDAIALLMALASSHHLTVAAITCVAGNVDVDEATDNALRVRELAGRTEVPVHRGCSRPLIVPLHTYFAGQGGLTGAELPAATSAPAEGHAVDVIVELARREPEGTLTIAGLGPLTNLAMAIAKEPDAMARVARIVLMGGAIGRGNATPAAEFNMFTDPHAAAIVFGSGVDVVMLGLEACQQARATAPRMAALRAIDTQAAAVTVDLLEGYGNAAEHDRLVAEGPPLFDPCVVGWLLDPGLFRGTRCRVDIELASPLSLGRTVVDLDGVGGGEPNTFVVNHVDADGLFSLLADRLGRLA